MGHTMGQRIRLSGTCSRNNEQRASTVNVAPMFDSATLLVVEPVQITSDHVPPHQAAAPMFSYAAWPESWSLAQNMNAGARNGAGPAGSLRSRRHLQCRDCSSNERKKGYARVHGMRILPLLAQFFPVARAHRPVFRGGVGGLRPDHENDQIDNDQDG